MAGEDETGEGRARPLRGAGAVLADVLWRPPRQVHRWLPADDVRAGDAAGGEAPSARLGGVCAATAARTGRPVAEVRRRFARSVLPLLGYPLLWLVRLAGRPAAEGRERFDGTLVLAAAALATAVAVAVQLGAYGTGAFVSAVFGAALGAPLLALRASVLLTWRLMTAALVLTTLPLPAGGPPLVPFPYAAAALYLLVLFLAGAQHDRSTVLGIGACTAAAVIAVAAITGFGAAGAWCAVAAAAVLLLGDNVRQRGAHAGRLRRAIPSPGVGGGSGGTERSVRAPDATTDELARPAAVPAESASGAAETATATVRPAPGGRRECEPASGGEETRVGGRGPREGDPGGLGVLGPTAVVRAVQDALWRTPGARPQGPFRLFHGPRRPAEGRIVAGVCAGLARRSQPMTITLRVLFPLISFPLGILVYLLLWLLLPDERTEVGDTAETEAEPTGSDGDGRRLPPVQPREVTAWFLLFGLSCGLAALITVQLALFHQVRVPVSIVLGAVVGLPFALLPIAPLLTWRFMAAGMFAMLFSVSFAAPDISAVPYHLWPWPVAALVALPVVLYLVAVNYPGRTAVGVGVVTVAADIAAAYLILGTHPGQVAWISIVAAAVLLFGYNVRGRRAAQRRLARESALRRRDRARQAVLEERSRIARELHDVVSHHMSMIAIQADAAPYKHAGLEPGPAGTFVAIRDAARDALGEMRRVVGLLREEDEHAEDAPQPGLDMLPDLVESARRAAVDVTLEGGPEAVHAAARGLPGAVDLSAYRIVQESVSNAGRHAPGAPVTVSLTRTPGTLTVRVVSGPPPAAGGGATGGGSRTTTAPDSGGHGLVGMRERAAMLGGRLSAAPTKDGGFAVVAELPVPADAGGRGAEAAGGSGGAGDVGAEVADDATRPGAAGSADTADGVGADGTGADGTGADRVGADEVSTDSDANGAALPGARGSADSPGGAPEHG